MARLFKMQNVLDGYRKMLCVRPNFYQQACSIKKDTKDKLDALNVPDKPKKPMTPFFRYLLEHRQSLLKENPNLKLTEVSKALSEKWKAVDENTKQKYVDVYKKEFAEYQAKMVDYKTNLSDEQKEALENAKVEKQKDKKKRKLHKAWRDTNKPKKPVGAFMYYLFEEARSTNKKPLEISAVVKEKWHSLPENEKAKYHNIYQQCKEKYEEELLKWEHKMIAEGKEDLVRQKTLRSDPIVTAKVSDAKPPPPPLKQLKKPKGPQ